MKSMLVLQKDLEVLRQEVGRPSGRFEYMLFYKGKHVVTRIDDREFTFAAVFAKTSPGELVLESLRRNAASFETHMLEDNNTFIVPITINS